jgi:hypothetical protein
MSSSVQFKLKSAREFEKLEFSGMFISVSELKSAILAHRSFKSAAGSFGLVLSNAQTNEGTPPSPRMFPHAPSPRIWHTPARALLKDSRLPRAGARHASLVVAARRI